MSVGVVKTKMTNPSSKPLHRFGQLSLGFGIAALLLFLLNASLLLLDAAYAEQTAPAAPAAVSPSAPPPSEPSTASNDVLPAAKADRRFILLAVFSFAANLLGIAFGAGGLVQSEQHKAFAVSGLTLNALVLFFFCCMASTMIPTA